MKTKIRVLMMVLAVILLGVLILGFQDVIPMRVAMNVVASGVFLGVLLVLIYMGADQCGEENPALVGD